MFVDSNDKVCKKVQFGAFWSIFGHWMVSLCLEPSGWMKLKIKGSSPFLFSDPETHHTHFFHLQHPLIPPTTSTLPSPTTSTHFTYNIHTHFTYNIHLFHLQHPHLLISPTTSTYFTYNIHTHFTYNIHSLHLQHPHPLHLQHPLTSPRNFVVVIHFQIL